MFKPSLFDATSFFYSNVAQACMVPLATRCYVRPLYARTFPYLGFQKLYTGQTRPVYCLESTPRKSLTADFPVTSRAARRKVRNGFGLRLGICLTDHGPRNLEPHSIIWLVMFSCCSDENVF